MTAGELIARVDALRPNSFEPNEKLRWLRLLELQLQQELQATHEGAAAVILSPRYEADTELLAPEPYALELYTAWLYSQIDLHNGEITRYNQSIALLATAWRSLADWVNRTRRPKGAACWKL